jgi:hypothetical protein
VAAYLPASVLQPYQVVLDYGKRTLTLAEPGTIRPQGVAVPFQLDTATGLIAVNASIDGRPYAITIDNGSAYTWLRKRTANDWLGAHPTWARGTGAVGAGNMMMLGDSTESTGTLMRIPEITLGKLTLHDVGALAAGESHRFPGDLELFDWYSKKNALPVIGWIGGNVLKGPDRPHSPRQGRRVLRRGDRDEERRADGLRRRDRRPTHQDRRTGSDECIVRRDILGDARQSRGDDPACPRAEWSARHGDGARDGVLTV